MQRPAKPCTPVRFRPQPPDTLTFRPQGPAPRTSARALTALGLLLILACGFSVPVEAASAVQSAGIQAAVSTIKQAQASIEKEDFRTAWSLLEDLMSGPRFGALAAPQQRVAVLLGAWSAYGLDRPIDAHALSQRATEFGGAGPDEWLARAFFAAAADDAKDCAAALASTATRWPDQVQRFDTFVVQYALRGTYRDPEASEQRFALLARLFNGAWTPEDGSDPEPLWFALLEGLIELGDEVLARRVAGSLTSPSSVIPMRVDVRFQSVLPRDHPTLDVRASIAATLEKGRARMLARPELLLLVNAHVTDLHRALKFTEALAVADEAVARVARRSRRAEPAFADLDDEYPWLLNQRSRVLASLGRLDESIRQLREAALKQEGGASNVSQTINLGYLYLAAGRPADALVATEAVDWSKGLSDYGRYQLQAVRYAALRSLQRADEAEEALAWLRANRRTSPSTYQWALIENGDLDGAAAVLIARFDAPEDRSDALVEVQEYSTAALTEVERAHYARSLAVIARPDVQVALRKIGVVERFDLLPP